MINRKLLRQCIGLGTVVTLLMSCNIPLAITPSPTTQIPGTTPSPTGAPISKPVISNPYMAIVGPMEVVYDWSADRCAGDDVPDMPLRPFVDAEGKIQANRSWPENRRFKGADLDSIRPLCDIILKSDLDRDPAHYNYKVWIQALYTEDGKTIHAILHNEHNCNDVGEDFCWYQNMTYAVSTDGGATFQQPAPPDNYVAGLPYRFESGVGVYGLIGGSNIIKGKDGDYYMLALNKAYKEYEQHTCLLRTDDLSNPSSWRAWDGSGFNMRFVSPYVEADFQPKEHVCPAVDGNSYNLSSMSESLIYNTYLDRYVVVSLGNGNIDGITVSGIYYSTSKDLIHWEPKKLLVKINLGGQSGAGSPDGAGYAVLLDPDSATRNFETADQSAYIYFTQQKYTSGIASLDYDLVRFPVEFFASEQETVTGDARTTLDLNQEPQSGNVMLSGDLTALSGNPVPGAEVEFTWSPDDAVGLPYVYTVTTTVPENATGGIVGFRVNEDCSCKGKSEFYVYEYSYTEADGKNRVSNPKFSNGLGNYSNWGAGKLSVETSDQGSGRMLHVTATPEQNISLISTSFKVTPRATFTFSVHSRVVPGSYGSGYFGLFFTTADPKKEALRITIPYKVPATLFGSASTDKDGRFEYVWKIFPSTAYTVQAVYAGNERFWPSDDMVWSAGNNQPVTINIFKKTNVVVPLNAPVNMTFHWAAKTTDQVQEFLDNATFDVVLDGKPVPDMTDCWGAIGSNGTLFSSQWLCPLGILSPGQHRVEIKISLAKTVSDGFSEYSGIVFQNTISIEVK